MNATQRIATLALAAAAAALTYASTPALAAIELPKFSIHVQGPRIDDGLIEKIQPGQTKDEVTSLIGAPQRTARLALSQTTSWDYDYRDAWGYDSTFSVVFNDTGVVQNKANVRRRY